MDVIARRGETMGHAMASGQDICAVTAPLVAEAFERIVSSPTKISGTVAPGEVFDAGDFLHALAPRILVDFQRPSEARCTA